MRKPLIVAGVLLLVAALATGLVVSRAAKQFSDPFRGYSGDSLRVEIPRGRSARQILDGLEEQGVIRNALHARLFLVRSMGDPPLKAGEYLFEEPLATEQVLRKLARGEVITHAVTIVEGLTLEETALLISEAGFGDLEPLLEAMRNPSLVADLDPAADDLEGYLFPDTYSFARGTTETQIVATLVATFRRRLEQISLQSSEEVRSIVTLASIIEKEAQLDDERPLIGAVFANRLERGIPLAADPTIIFALKLEDRWNGNIRKADLKLDSPFNTYLHAGLPPSPICSPGLASLSSAARPAETKDLYFVSRNDGSHVFATNLAEHNRNVERWQRQYWRERWARERRERAQGD
jgi:UPF0755 protein